MAIAMMSQEDNLKEQGGHIVNHARALVVDSPDSYRDAGEFAKKIKQVQSQIKEYWAAPKEAAHKAHADICSKEREMLKSLEEAEVIVKRSMAQYQVRIEEERRKVEEEARRKQREEESRLLREAQAAEEQGDEKVMESKLEEAVAVSDKPVYVPPVIKPVAEGISTRKMWRAEIVEDAMVPAYIAGVVIRPVDVKAIERLAEASKGSVEIPGVRLYQETIMSIRK